MKVAVRKGDPAFLLEFVRTHTPERELADQIDAVSRKLRRETKPR